MCACDVGAECMVVVGRLRERGLLPYLSVRPCGVHAETGARRTGAGGEALAFERSIISVGVIRPQRVRGVCHTCDGALGDEQYWCCKCFERPGPGRPAARAAALTESATAQTQQKDGRSWCEGDQ